MVLITGTSQGIGKATALFFLKKGYKVSGIDILPSTIEQEGYQHYICDVRDKEKLPDIPDVEILFSNAGVQNEEDAIDVNLKGSMNVVEKYAFQDKIQSVLINASSSGHTGFEFTNYSVSKGGLLTYMKNVAVRLAKTYKATCNSLSLGGVITPLNDEVLNEKDSWKRIMDVTPLKKWMDVKEVAQWVYFLTVINKSCTGQDILIDNGEKDLNCTFVWPDFE